MGSEDGAGWNFDAVADTNAGLNPCIDLLNVHFHDFRWWVQYETTLNNLMANELDTTRFYAMQFYMVTKEHSRAITWLQDTNIFNRSIPHRLSFL